MLLPRRERLRLKSSIVAVAVVVVAVDVVVVAVVVAVAAVHVPALTMPVMREQMKSRTGKMRRESSPAR